MRKKIEKTFDDPEEEQDTHKRVKVAIVVVPKKTVLKNDCEVLIVVRNRINF